MRRPHGRCVLGGDEATTWGARPGVEAIAEVFNLFNEPTTYSVDFRRPEQRVGQLGLRFSF